MGRDRQMAPGTAAEEDPVEIDYVAFGRALADLARHDGRALEARGCRTSLVRMQRVINQLVNEMDRA